MPAVFDQRWQCLNEHLDHALDLAEPERIQWLAAVAQADPEMAALVKNLLAARDREGFADFLAGTSPLTAEEAASATLVGLHVGPYVIEAEIGRGGMGSVWRARRADGRFEGTVAIKFVHAAWIGRAGEQRFRTEGNLLGRLDHSNIARLIDARLLGVGVRWPRSKSWTVLSETFARLASSPCDQPNHPRAANLCMQPKNPI